MDWGRRADQGGTGSCPLGCVAACWHACTGSQRGSFPTLPNPPESEQQLHANAGLCGTEVT
eukprot:2493859-Prorocentrum_lima.AAC.1